MSVDIYDYFNKHALNVDDNVLNVIYYNLVMNKNVNLFSYISEQDMILKRYNLLFENDENLHFRPFLKMNTALLTHDILIKICKLENVVYGGSDGSVDLRNIWNDVDINYYISNDMRIDINAIAKIIIKRHSCGLFSPHDIDIYGDLLMSEIEASGAELCEHVTIDMITSIMSSLVSLLDENDLTMEDVATQVNRELDSSNLVKQRSLRPRRN